MTLRMIGQARQGGGGTAAGDTGDGGCQAMVSTARNGPSKQARAASPGVA